eukprot:Gb_00680 [translate_table: standard]
MEVEKALCPASIPLPSSFVPHSSGSSWVIFTHWQLFHFAFPFTPCAGVCTLLIIATTIASCCGPFGTSSGFFAEDVRSQPGRRILRVYLLMPMVLALYLSELGV